MDPFMNNNLGDKEQHFFYVKDENGNIFPVLNPAYRPATINEPRTVYGYENMIRENVNNLFIDPNITNQIPKEEPATTLGLPLTSPPLPDMTIPRLKPSKIPIVTSEPIYSCEFCKQPFTRKNSLRRHEALHSGLKNYRCVPCGKEFSRTDIFKRHKESKRCKALTQKGTWIYYGDNGNETGDLVDNNNDDEVKEENRQ